MDRPEALNALSTSLIKEVCSAVTSFDADPEVSAIVITGSDKAFAAGADIKEMASSTFSEVYAGEKFNDWAPLQSVRKPIIGAVNGYALGGGCELAMMCDIIIAGEKAKFAQPEINLGLIPGWGGTQRLIRAIGKSKAMEMCLTGSMITAQEAQAAAGLVSKVVPPEEMLEGAMKLAEDIGSKSLMCVLMVKEAVAAADELSLHEGLKFERRLFHSLFATADQKEGVTAFATKREPQWKHK
ncbi:unnamed protein product [Chrysoparadoxa australica]